MRSHRRREVTSAEVIGLAVFLLLAEPAGVADAGLGRGGPPAARLTIEVRLAAPRRS